MENPLIAGNWKMNYTSKEATELVSQIKPTLEKVTDVETIICPPFTALSTVKRILEGSRIKIGAQDVFHEKHGAYTGEISPTMLTEFCQYVILGHSERRQLLSETDTSVSLKIESALKSGLRPIMCVGETLKYRNQGLAEKFVEEQIRNSLNTVKSIENLVLAYEPIWAIGTDKSATPADAQTMMVHIRQTLESIYGKEPASEVPLLYGGSVKASNIKDFMSENNINGALVGGASLNPESFVQLVQNTSKSTF